MKLIYEGLLKESKGGYLKVNGIRIQLTTVESDATVFSLYKGTKYYQLCIDVNTKNSRALDIWDDKNPKLILYKYNGVSKNQKWNVSFNKNRINLQSVANNYFIKLYRDRDRDSDNVATLGLAPNQKSTLTMVSVTNNKSNMLAITSFNLAFGVQLNKLYKSSESIMVEKCQQKYGVKTKANLPICTFNAAHNIMHSFFPKDTIPDIIGIQEAEKTTISHFVNYMQSQVSNTKANYVLIGKAKCCIIYNQLTMGISRKVKFNSIPGIRCIQGVFFPKTELCFITLWLDHNLNVKKTIEGLRIMNKNNIKPKRIILTMDSNDDGTLLGQTLKIAGLILKHGGKPLKSCCEDSNYIYYGDYIFDSEQQKKESYYGIPKSVNSKTQYMSDHLPIILYN